MGGRHYKGAEIWARRNEINDNVGKHSNDIAAFYFGRPPGRAPEAYLTRLDILETILTMGSGELFAVGGIEKRIVIEARHRWQ